MTEPLSTGVIGVGSMGRNHARVYRNLPSTELVGVADADTDLAREVADDFDTQTMAVEELLDAADAISIAVPTQFHYETARNAIEEGVHILVEKPFVERIEHGQILIERARDLGVTLQVGHIERFNPAVRALDDILPGLDIIALDAMRLGPPVDREIDVNPILDLMIHDIDIIRSIADTEVARVSATRSRDDPYVTASLGFENDIVGTLTASRVTQEKVRTLAITARECRVTLDFIDQSVEIHRRSIPEYVERGGDVRFRQQDVVERPTIQNGEPLKAELDSFADSVRSGEPPVVPGEDGLAALRLAKQLTEAAGIEKKAPSLEIQS